MFSKSNSFIPAIILLSLMMITRASHFGTSALLPDASIACFFLMGLLLTKMRWFVIGLVLSVVIDFSVTRWMGVSDYCMSIGYWGLIPTYLLVWWMGRRLNITQADVKTYLIQGWLATSIAFVLSNLFWFMFSDKVSSMSLVDFSTAVAHYYVPYTGFTMFYLVCAIAIMAFNSSHYLKALANK
jgi:hypothetical protein